MAPIRRALSRLRMMIAAIFSRDVVWIAAGASPQLGVIEILLSLGVPQDDHVRSFPSSHGINRRRSGLGMLSRMDAFGEFFDGFRAERFQVVRLAARD